MLQENREFLVSLLNLNLKLDALDETIVNELESIFANEAINNYEKQLVVEQLRKRIELISDQNKDFLQKVVSHFPDNIYVHDYLRLQLIELGDVKENISSILENILNKTYDFAEDQKLEYMFYDKIVKFTILQGESELIKKAIDKIQSI
ncbi:hypothetical protein [Brevibacillus sp. SYSU BS000544]|uniref:hypothetical protein n=1 Tax=Brevibacillus sp. SYSU BS000544 TaxID=3416443 RepID=UPI003CE487DE